MPPGGSTHTTSEEVSGEKESLILIQPLHLIANLQEIKGIEENILNDNIEMPTARSKMWATMGQMTQFLQHVNCNIKERTHILKGIQKITIWPLFGTQLEQTNY